MLAESAASQPEASSPRVQIHSWTCAGCCHPSRGCVLVAVVRCADASRSSRVLHGSHRSADFPNPVVRRRPHHRAPAPAWIPALARGRHSGSPASRPLLVPGRPLPSLGYPALHRMTTCPSGNPPHHHLGIHNALCGSPPPSPCCIGTIPV
jgi:hypothetical protein